jgi:hypothetical protein
MRKILKIIIFVIVAWTTSVAFSKAEACPPCPKVRPYCIYPNTPGSHCEHDLPSLKRVDKPVEVEFSGQKFIIAPKSQVDIK